MEEYEAHLFSLKVLEISNKNTFIEVSLFNKEKDKEYLLSTLSNEDYRTTIYFGDTLFKIRTNASKQTLSKAYLEY